MELDCESYSLAIESQSDFYASLSSASQSRDAASTSSIASQGNSSAATTEIGNASPGATGTQIASQTTVWADRPSSTSHSQQSSGVSVARAPKHNALSLVTIFLAFVSVLGCP